MGDSGTARRGDVRVVRVRLPGTRPRRWHLALLERIAALPGHRAEADPTPGADAWPPAADLLFALETVVGGLPRTGPSTRVAAAELARFVAGREGPDLVLDLVGDADAPAGVPLLRLAFDGAVGDPALLAALVAGRAPWVTLEPRAAAGGTSPVAAGRPGSELPGVLREAFEDTVSGATGLVLAWLADPTRPATSGGDVTVGSGAGSAPGAARLGEQAARRLAHAVVARLYRLCYRAPHWRTGWRRLGAPGTPGGADLVDLRRHPDTGWNVLPDDGHRFYADPFPIEHAGQTYLFVEEFVHATGRGIVSAVPFGPEGPRGRPEPVLETAYHLSYPFVFARDGVVWMVPESSAAGRIDLYRATAFPGGWVHEATLVAGVVASDATLVEHDGRWWLFATVRDAPVGAPLGRGSWSDALHLWWAPDFRGPWTPHSANPVLVDVAAARPAGAMVRRGGTLIRPVQDCSTGYGRALGLARVDRLDAGGYQQTVLATITPGPRWPGSRLHTLNRAGTLEVIDGSARSPRFARRWLPH